MAITLTTVTGGPGGFLGSQKGQLYTGTFPISSTTQTARVGPLYDNDIVDVIETSQASGTNYCGLCEAKASRSASAYAGTVTLVPKNGAPTSNGVTIDLIVRRP